MFWFIWRQYRKQVLITSMALAIYFVALLVTGLHVTHEFNVARGGGALGYPVVSENIQYLGYCSLAIPILLGLFWGVPLFAKEYEDGTHRLAWAQSVPRKKWLLAKLSWLLGMSVLFGALTAIAITVWGHAGQMLTNDRFFWPISFTMQGFVPFGLTIFAVSLGAVVGAYMRRVLPALILTLGIFAAFWFVVPSYVRPHYQTPVKYNYSYSQTTVVQQDGSYALGGNANAFSLPEGSWILDPGDQSTTCTPTSMTTPAMAGKVLHCTVYYRYRYQPASRFWRFQVSEALLYIVLSALILPTTYWTVLKRDA